MPLTVREQIMAAFKTQLASLAGVTVERNRPDEFPAASLPALNLVDGDHQVDHELTGRTGYIMTATVEGFVKGASGEAAVTALNALYGDVVKKCGPLQTFGGLAELVSEAGLVVELDRGGPEEPQAAFALEIEIRFATAQGDPTTLAP